MSDPFVRRRNVPHGDGEEEEEEDDEYDVPLDHGDDRYDDDRSTTASAYEDQGSLASTVSRRRRQVTFTGRGEEEEEDEEEEEGVGRDTGRGGGDLYPGEGDTPSEGGDPMSRQSTYARQQSTGGHSTYSRQPSFLSRQISNFSRSSSFQAVMARTNTLGRSLAIGLGKAVGNRLEFGTEDEVEEAAEILEEARARRLERGEGRFERATTMLMKRPEQFGRSLTLGAQFVRTKTLKVLDDVKEILDTPEVKAAIQATRKKIVHLSAGRPSWDPEPTKLPLPSSFNCCSLLIILLCLMFPILFLQSTARHVIMNVVVNNIIGRVEGTSLPPLVLPSLGEVCSSGGYGQQALQPGSPTLDQTWWSSALGNGAQIQLQSVTSNLWWGAQGGDSVPPTPTYPPPAAPSISTHSNFIPTAVNGSYIAAVDMNATLWSATDYFGSPLTGTFWNGNFYNGTMFYINNIGAADGELWGWNWTSWSYFYNVAFASPELAAQASALPLPSLVATITNCSLFVSGTQYTGTLYEGILYNNSFLDLTTLQNLPSTAHRKLLTADMESGVGRKLLQNFSPVSQSGSLTNSTVATPPPPPAAAPPPNTFQQYSYWSTGPLSLNSGPPNTSDFITVQRLNSSHFYLMAPNGNLIAPTPSGRLVALSPNKTATSVFTAVVVDGTTVQLIASNGKYVAWGSSGGRGSLQLEDSPSAAASSLGGSLSGGNYTSFRVREVQKVARMRGVNLGGWLLLEEWMTPWLYANVPDLIDGWQISLKSATTGKFVTVNPVGGQVYCRADAASAWEYFNIRRLNGPTGPLQLRDSHNGFYVTPNNGGGGEVVAQTASMGGKGYESYTLVVNGNSDQVQLQAANGQFLQANSDGSLSADGGQERIGGATTFIIGRVTAVQGEWQVGSGNPKAAADLAQHRSTFVTESDWLYMATLGINTVRIPVGYWMAEGLSPEYPFVAGSLAALDAAFGFAEKYNIRIWMSMHGAPGGQNPGHECASRDGIIDWGRPGSNTIAQTLSAIDFFAGRYSKSKAYFGFGVLNEPNVAGPASVSDLKAYHVEAFATIRKYSACAFVGISGFLGGSDSDFDGHMADPLQFNNIVYDVHNYQVFDPTTFAGHNVDWHLNYTRTTWAQQIAQLQQGGRTVLVGEWSLGLPSDVGANSHDYARYSWAQLETFDAASAGWFYWSLKVSQGSTGFPNWSLMDAFPRGWLHYPTS